MQISGGGLALVWLWMLLSPSTSVDPSDDDRQRHKGVNTFVELGAGASGGKCTEDGRHCIKGAECVQGKCVCPPDSPKGDALIACAKEDEFLCVASLDPDVMSFAGARARVSLPCRHRLSYFITPNSANTPGFPFCAFEVSALTSVTDYGVFYQRGFDISISLGDFQRREFVSLDIKKIGIVEDDLYKYLVSADHSHSPLGGAVHEDWNGVSVQCYFDPTDNFAVVWVPECHAAVQFRPFNYSKDNPVQAFKPGIVIRAPGNAIFEQRFGGFPGSLCAHPDDDPDIYQDLAKERKLKDTTTALTYEMLIVGVAQEGGDYDRECKDAQGIVAHCWTREEAVNSCNCILSHGLTRRCLQKKKINLMLTFTNCLSFFCFQEHEACANFTSDLSQCQSTHQLLSEVQCPEA